MDTAREDRIERLFEEASALPPEQRAAFLDRACGSDADLRAEMEGLVAHADKAHRFVDRVAGPAMARAMGEAMGDSRGDAEPGADPFVGQQVAHFRILEKLGGGGMGRVYKALDLRLDRTVVLKFLPPHLGADEEATQRFIYEAKAASGLDHPHICVIYEIRETDQGRLFIAMAHYEGETLKPKIARGPLQVREALDYVAQIAEGLQRAHASGIVHRDIKPANVIVTVRGKVKILDFGLAKMAGSDLTREGTAIGTVAYMSPEQTHGNGVDARTDIWSLGVVLYEMLTGKRPFSSESDQTLIHGIRHDAPKPFRDLRPDAPANVAALVSRCLEKTPERRYHDAGELLAAVRAVQAGGTAVRRPAWRLRVPPNGSVAVVLGLLLLVAGTWLAGKRPRQAEVQETARLTAAAPRVDPDAFALYLKASRVWPPRTDSEAIASLEQAIEKDSTFALAYATVARRYAIFGRDRATAERTVAKALALDPSPEAYNARGLFLEFKDFDWSAAEAAFRRAIELSPHNSRAHHELGQLLMRVGRCDEAAAAEQHAVLQDPRSRQFQGGLGEIYLNCRRYDDAVREFETTLHLGRDARDSSNTYRDLGDVYFYERQYAEALAMYEKAGSVPGWARTPLGSRQEALQQIDKLKSALARDDRDIGVRWDLARLYTSLGERDSAITWLERAYERRDGMLVYLRVMPHFDPLRDDLRFQALLKKVGLTS